MQSFLSAEGCFGAIDHITNNWNGLNTEGQRALQHRAFNTLCYSLGPDFQYISGEHQVHEAKELWDHIK